jgi:hypothetical protein
MVQTVLFCMMVQNLWEKRSEDDDVSCFTGWKIRGERALASAGGSDMNKRSQKASLLCSSWADAHSASGCSHWKSDSGRHVKR